MCVNDKESQDKTCPDKDVTHDANPATEMALPEDVSVADESGHEDSAKTEHSPNVSGSSDVISGTPPKPNSRRQSFITLEKYVEGRPSSPKCVTKFTGPLTRTSCSQDSPKLQQLTPDASFNSQPETGKDAVQASPHSPNQTETKLETNIKVESAEEVKSTNGSTQATEDEDDVIPDTQTQVLNELDEPLGKSNLEVQTEMTSIEEDSETLTPAQDSSQVEPRRSGRRRSKPVRPGEELVEQVSKNKQQKKDSVNESPLVDSPKPSSPEQTDNILPGKRRRSKMPEENKDESGRSHTGDLKGHHSQADLQRSAAATTTNSSKGRSSRGKSKELSQTETSAENQSPSQTDGESPLSQSESPSHRPVRRTRMSVTKLENSGKRNVEESSQNDSLETSTKKPADAQVSDSGSESQSPGRPKRTRRAEATDDQKDKPVNGNELSDSQALTPSKGRVGRRKRSEEEMNASKDTTPLDSINSESVKTEEVREVQDAQGRGKYNTRRSSQGLLTAENSESDSSDAREGQRSKKPRGSKSLASVVGPSTTHESVPETTLDKDNGDPIEMPKKELTACLDVSMLHEDKVADKAAEVPEMEHDTANAKSPEKKSDEELPVEVESSKELSTVPERSIPEEGAPAALQNSLVLPEKVALKTPEFHKCPHSKRGRGRRRSANCNCFQAHTNTQENVSGESQDKAPPEPNSLPSEFELSNVKPTVIEKDNVTPPECPVATEVKISAPSPNLADKEVLAESPVKESNVSELELSDKKEGTIQAEEDQDKNADASKSNDQEEEQGNIASDTVGQAQSSSPEDDLKIECQEQPGSPDSQNNTADVSVNETGDKLMPEKEEMYEGGNGSVPLKEGTELDACPLDGVEEETQIDRDVQPEVDLESAASVPEQIASLETCLDSPPKQESSDVHCGNQEVAQSPNCATRGVWSPSASPSTSILKKGQKRQFEEDTPSPLLKVVMSFNIENLYAAHFDIK